MMFRRSGPVLPRDGDMRRAERRDVPRLTQLWLELMEMHGLVDHRFSVTPDAAQVMTRRFQYLLTDRDALALVNEAEGNVVGFAIGHIDMNLPFFPGGAIGFISDVYVEEPFRRQGRARRLIGVLREWFRDRKVSSVQLHAATCNPDARKFWESMGFEDYLIRMWTEP